MWKIENGNYSHIRRLSDSTHLHNTVSIPLIEEIIML